MSLPAGAGFERARQVRVADPGRAATAGEVQ